jgi:nucleoid-associated protein YgaU
MFNTGRQKVFLILLVFISSIALFSCGTPVPEKEIATAKKEIQRAKDTQASEYDSTNLSEAEAELNAALKFVQDKDNDKAKNSALNSILKARNALKTSKLKIIEAKLNRADELLKEAKRYHAQKIASEGFKNGENKLKSAKAGSEKVKKTAAGLGSEKLRQGDIVGDFEKFIKECDAVIKLATEASSAFENALVAAKDRIVKLEANIASAAEILSKLQGDRAIAENFKDKLKEIKDKLNSANEEYKKFKFTDNPEEALKHLVKAEELASAANAEATKLSTEGREQLQAIYKTRAENSLNQAREQVNQAERIYNSRQIPAVRPGNTGNPWIPRNYRNLRNRAHYVAAGSGSAEENSSGSGTTNQSGNSSASEASASAPAQSGPPSSPSTSIRASEPAADRASAPASTRSREASPAAAENRPSAEGSASDASIERSLENSGSSEQALSLEDLYKKMIEKLKSAEDKYKKKDYVGAWEDAEEAKRLAAMIKERSGQTGAASGSSATSLTRNYTNLKIWKYYVVKYRRRNTDCLWRIALKMYNDASLWPVIWYANKLKIADPDIIKPGQKLVIPKIDNSGRN